MLHWIFGKFLFFFKTLNFLRVTPLGPRWHCKWFVIVFWMWTTNLNGRELITEICKWIELNRNQPFHHACKLFLTWTSFLRFYVGEKCFELVCLLFNIRFVQQLLLTQGSARGSWAVSKRCVNKLQEFLIPCDCFWNFKRKKLGRWYFLTCLACLGQCSQVHLFHRRWLISVG